MRRFLRENDLSLVMFGIFAVCLVGQGVAGFRVYNHEQVENSRAVVDGLAYLRTGHFIEAVFENWESEFLQMAAYVLLTAYLFQRGSVESRVPVSSLQTRQMCKSRPLPDLPTRSPLISSIRSSGSRTRLIEPGLGT